MLMHSCKGSAQKILRGPQGVRVPLSLMSLGHKNIVFEGLFSLNLYRIRRHSSDIQSSAEKTAAIILYYILVYTLIANFAILNARICKVDRK
jgi:hypothetical protein